MEQMTQDLIRQVNEMQRRLDGLVRPEQLDDRFINLHTINGASGQFATAQDAIDFAEANGYYHVYFPAGTYGSISLTNAGMTIEGASAVQTTFLDNTGHCIDVGNADWATIKSLRIVGTAGGGNARNGINIGSGASRTFIRGIEVASSDQHGIYSDGDFTVIIGNVFLAGVDGTRVVFDTNSAECILVGNSNINADIINNGGTNVIGNNG